MKKTLIIFGLSILCYTMVMAQNVGINSTGNQPDASAGLDISFSNEGLLIPRVDIADLSTAAPVTSPATSLLVYNTNTTTGPGYFYWDGNKWSKLSDINDGEPWKLTGNAGTTAGTNFLGTTDDVSLVFKTKNNERMRISNTGNVGIGTTTPGYPITVVSTALTSGAFFNTSTSTNNYGVYGQCSSTDGYGYGGNFKGGYVGAFGFVNPTGSDNYIGIKGQVNGGSGINYGTYGYANTSSTAFGAYGNSTTTGSGWSYGVYGYSTSNSGTPVGTYGRVVVANGYGVFGSNGSATGTGIIAKGNNLSTFYYPSKGTGLAANGDSIGLYSYGTNTGNNIWGGYFAARNNTDEYAFVGGNYNGTAYKIFGQGSVGTIVKRNDGTRAGMTCPETPEILFQDYGVGKLVNGKAHIDLDPNLAKNIIVNKKHPLRVFVQLEGDCKGVYVTNKTQIGFDVIELQNGKSNVNFSWTIVANRADVYDNNGNIISKNADIRFPDAPGPMPAKAVKVQNEKENIGEDINKEH